MDWFTIVKRYYDWKCYTNDNVKVFVDAGKITSDQYYTITGEVYPVAQPVEEPTPPTEETITDTTGTDTTPTEQPVV